MLVLVQILLVPVAWWIGKVFANYFEGRRPPKLYAALFGILMGGVLIAVLVTVRYYVAGWLLNDPGLRIRVEWFGPLDPPAIFLYMFFAYGGAVSFYSRPRA